MKSKKELIELLKDTSQLIDRTLNSLDEAMLEKNFPLESPGDLKTSGFLFHLYGHLNYHLGQLSYLKKLLADE